MSWSIAFFCSMDSGRNVGFCWVLLGWFGDDFAISVWVLRSSSPDRVSDDAVRRTHGQPKPNSHGAMGCLSLRLGSMLDADPACHRDHASASAAGAGPVRVMKTQRSSGWR